MNGYAGKSIRVNLTDRKITVFKTPVEWERKFLGGIGMGAKILWDELAPDVDPLSPSNKIVFLTGPVDGTLFPPSGRFEAVSRSPLTGWWAHSSSGGFWGPELKYAGYDLIIIEGASDRPLYLHIDNDFIELRDAGHLWGLDTEKATDSIKSELNDDEVKVLVIGPAGENLVKYANIMVDYYRALGRTGLGAILGSKKLKGIAVRGTKGIDIANHELFNKLLADMRKKYQKDAEYYGHIDSMRKYGTFALTDWENAIGRLPTKNHWTGYFPNAENTIGMHPLREKHYKKHESCFNCGIQCKYISEVRSGKYKGTRSGGPEYETVEAFTSNFLSTDTDALIRANYLSNLLGMDSISLGHSISFAYEAYENGIITKKDADGRELRWGDMDTVMELVESIAYRKDDFSRLLGEGSKKAAEEIGGDAWKYAIHVNGLEASGQDGRTHKSMGLTYAINVRGADHLTSISCIDELGYKNEAFRRYGEARGKYVIDRLSEAHKGYLVAEMEELYALCDSLVLCKYGVMWPPLYYFEDMARLVHAVTGFEEYSDVKELRKMARRIVHIRRAFNVRLGWTKKQDALHPRFTKEPMPTGPGKGNVVHLEPMLAEYYLVRGYDWETGLPTEGELNDVGLSDVAGELSKAGKLASKYTKPPVETDATEWLANYR